MFSPYVQERLKFYVYLLTDPRNEKIFYVGKGQGNRIFAHANDTLAAQEEPRSDKLDQIRDILTAGLQVRYELLRFGLSEAGAFEVEAAAIELLGLHELTNLVAGHHVSEQGRMTVDVAISLIDAPPVSNITQPAILIRIPKLWYPAMPEDELYEATHGWWVIGERRERAKYAFAVSRGIIREVYEIYSWRRRQPGDRGSEEDGSSPSRRFAFDGSIAGELAHHRNHSVRQLYKPGDQSPIKFLNC